MPHTVPEGSQVPIAAGDDVAVRVLISYSHGDPAHDDLVRSFWTFLRGEGIDARLDVTAAGQRQFWPEWMSEQIREARFVILVASPAYRERAENRGDMSVGRGVRWEARQLQELLYSDGDSGFGKVVPVVLPGGQVQDLPKWVLPVGGTTYRVAEFTSEAADDLLRLLTSQPLDTEPPLGPLRRRPPRPRADLDVPVVADRRVESAAPPDRDRVAPSVAVTGSGPVAYGGNITITGGNAAGRDLKVGGRTEQEDGQA